MATLLICFCASRFTVAAARRAEPLVMPLRESKRPLDLLQQALSCALRIATLMFNQPIVAANDIYQTLRVSLQVAALVASHAPWHRTDGVLPSSVNRPNSSTTNGLSSLHPRRLALSLFAPRSRDRTKDVVESSTATIELSRTPNEDAQLKGVAGANKQTNTIKQIIVLLAHNS